MEQHKEFWRRTGPKISGPNLVNLEGPETAEANPAALPENRPVPQPGQLPPKPPGERISNAVCFLVAIVVLIAVLAILLKTLGYEILI